MKHCAWQVVIDGGGVEVLKWWSAEDAAAECVAVLNARHLHQPNTDERGEERSNNPPGTQRHGEALAQQWLD